ncbi:anthrone oxygenase family protein [Kribbella speibonae]|uniref:DUF1772 domain-containing protein n=1 Tax=Kribbella speibonae TaxID=1572660 RepID=A0A4R0J795_9ACTN|nr:anthrone oxygenase family protein [Kribbella speibonae]TCC42503.1 DUF1772 domain-containing protein [Kribbella speibonae]
MARVVRGLSLVFSGVFAGFLVSVAVLENSLRGFGASVYTQVRLVELDSLDRLASVTLIPAIVTTVVLAIWARGNDRRVVLAAVALLVVVFVTTLAINLPINSDQTAWSVQNPPTDWAAVRDRWQLAHLIRTAAALLAFGALIGSTLSTRQPSRDPENGRRVLKEASGR